MPGFGSPFSGLANDRKLTDEELIASQVAAALDTDRAKPSWIVSHELALDEAPEAYKYFDARDNGWTKVILHPAGAQKGSNRQSTQKKAVRKEALNAHERGKSKFNDERSSPGLKLTEENMATDFSGQAFIIFQNSLS